MKIVYIFVVLTCFVSCHDIESNQETSVKIDFDKNAASKLFFEKYPELKLHESLSNIAMTYAIEGVYEDSSKNSVFGLHMEVFFQPDDKFMSIEIFEKTSYFFKITNGGVIKEQIDKELIPLLWTIDWQNQKPEMLFSDFDFGDYHSPFEINIYGCLLADSTESCYSVMGNAAHINMHSQFNRQYHLFKFICFQMENRVKEEE